MISADLFEQRKLENKKYYTVMRLNQINPWNLRRVSFNKRIQIEKRLCDCTVRDEFCNMSSRRNHRGVLHVHSVKNNCLSWWYEPSVTMYRHENRKIEKAFQVLECRLCCVLWRNSYRSTAIYITDSWWNTCILKYQNINYFFGNN